MNETHSADVIVVGGGLAGLTAAAYAARAGRRVLLCERARDVGGRAATQNESGFLFNLGPHALYRASTAAAVLAELGVAYSGKVPSGSGAYGVSGGRKHALPGGLVSLLTTSLLGLPGKIEVAKVLASLQRIDAARYLRVSVDEWLAETFRHEEVRALMRALVRVTSYANCPDRMSAGAAIRQLQSGFGGGVLYLDGGWQTLIEGLRRAVGALGVEVRTGARVDAVEGDGVVGGVRLAGGEVLKAAAVVLTGAPDEVSALVRSGEHPPLRRWVDSAVPVRAACLDLGLSRLPQPRATFGLGIDRPLYLSVHSAVANLGPEGSATVHVAKYLAPDDALDAAATQRELEDMMDLIQSGWRDLVRQRRFLPRLTVAHHVPLAEAGGGRAPVEVAGFANLFIAGDWVGDEAMLADASMASGRAAGTLAGSARGLHAAA